MIPRSCCTCGVVIGEPTVEWYSRTGLTVGNQSEERAGVDGGEPRSPNDMLFDGCCSECKARVVVGCCSGVAMVAAEECG